MLRHQPLYTEPSDRLDRSTSVESTSALVHNQESELAIGHPAQAQAAGVVAFVEKRGGTEKLLSAIRQAIGQY